MKDPSQMVAPKVTINPTAESAGGDVPNGDLENFVALVNALLSDLRSVGLSDGGDASRDDLSTP